MKIKLFFFSNIYLDDNNIISPKTNERLKVTDDNFLSHAIELLSIPLVIIVDGLDKVNILIDLIY